MSYVSSYIYVLNVHVRITNTGVYLVGYFRLVHSLYVSGTKGPLFFNKALCTCTYYKHRGLHGWLRTLDQ